MEGSNSSTAAPALSENVNLFQALRVLQEGENDQDANVTYKGNLPNISASEKLIWNFLLERNASLEASAICLKTGWFAALLALGCGTVCLLGGALLAMCTKMRKITIEKVLTASQFSGYMNHRGNFKWFMCSVFTPEEKDCLTVDDRLNFKLI